MQADPREQVRAKARARARVRMSMGVRARKKLRMRARFRFATIVIFIKFIPNSSCKSASGGSTVVQQLPHHPKVKGSSPSTTADIGSENIAKKVIGFWFFNMITAVCDLLQS